MKCPYFQSLIDTSSITLIDRLLTDTELWCIYTRARFHVSVPCTDALGGGVIEPLLLGSHPILSDIEPYRRFATQCNSTIVTSYDEKHTGQASNKFGQHN